MIANGSKKVVLKKDYIQSIVVFLIAVVGIAFCVFPRYTYYDYSIDTFEGRDIFSQEDGDTIANKELGIYYFDDELALLIAESKGGYIITSVLKVKDGKYAAKEEYQLYLFPYDSGRCSMIKTKKGTIKYTLIYGNDELKNTKGIESYSEYNCQKGVLYLAVIK